MCCTALALAAAAAANSGKPIGCTWRGVAEGRGRPGVERRRFKGEDDDELHLAPLPFLRLLRDTSFEARLNFCPYSYVSSFAWPPDG
jgi:hypothetical protein